jgi:dihydrofolate reductase
MKRIIIAAVADNGVIGLDNSLPWDLPDDWAAFKARTEGKPFIMGRLSYESPHALLSSHFNVIITRRTDEPHDGRTRFVPTLNAAWALLAHEPEVFVLGGARVFAEALPAATHMYLTHVHAQPPGDTYFPTWDSADWRIEWSDPRPADARHAVAFTFVDYVRI